MGTMEPADLLATIHQVITRNSYDYIIVGGGTAGLVLANRLSENESINVLVLEAGQLHEKDPLVDNPDIYLDQLFEPSHDWNFETVPQVQLNNRCLPWNRGKGLGGSSNLNFFQWTRPTRIDIEAWERLGNPGWTWDNLLPYFKRSEKFHKESESRLTSAHLPLDSRWFGKHDGISLSYAGCHQTGVSEVKKVFESFGITPINHSFGGDNFGLLTPIWSIEPETHTRSSSYTAFLRPCLTRPNLDVLTDATVTRLVLQDGLSRESKSVFAEAVEFIHGGQTYRVNTKREVILCAGTVKSPHILELSGIGNREILAKAGIDVKLHLPGVGENLQDHTYIKCLSFELKGHDLSRIVYNNTQNDQPTRLLHNSNLAWVPFQKLTENAENIIYQFLSKNTPEIDVPDSPDSCIQKQYRLLEESLSNSSIPDCEILISQRFGGFINASNSEKSYLTFAAGGVRPWSRGSIHTKSNDPLEHPDIDPRYFEKEIDLEILLQGVKFLRNFKNHSVFQDIITGEVNPGPTVATDEELKDHIRQNMTAFYHATGTLAMLPRENGGVVDPTLKIWGTDNIRVADLSIVPMVVSVHTQSTAYAIAEVAADIISGKISRL